MSELKAICIEHDPIAPFVVRLRDGTERRFSTYDLSELYATGRMHFFSLYYGEFALTTREVAEIDFRGSL